jgi:chromosomal replication initiation ATPase DnaA
MRQFESWRLRSRGHALLVTGARQVGKTYLLQAFGASSYHHMVHFDLVADVAARDSFSRAVSADDLKPCYLRAPQAVRQRNLVERAQHE